MSVALPPLPAVVLEKATSLPSGDHEGHVSSVVPGIVDVIWTTLPRSVASALTRPGVEPERSRISRVPSGDQSGLTPSDPIRCWGPNVSPAGPDETGVSYTLPSASLR